MCCGFIITAAWGIFGLIHLIAPFYEIACFYVLRNHGLCVNKYE